MQMAQAIKSSSILRLLIKLVEDQDAVITAAKIVSEKLEKVSQADILISEVVSTAREAKVFKKDNISMQDFIKLLHSHHLKQMALIKAQAKVKKTKTNKDAFNEKIEKLETEFARHIINTTKNPEAYLKIKNSVFIRLSGPQPTPIINQSLYVLACANFETFLSGLLQCIFTNNDFLLFREEEKFSWKQISKRGAVQKIRKDLVIKQRDDLLRQSASKWIKWFEDRARLKLEPNFKTECLQTYELRNLFAHEKSSRVMRLRVVPKVLIDVAVESFLRLAVEMTCAALSTFEKQLEIERDILVDGATQLTFDLLIKRRFKSVISLGEPILKLSKDNLRETQVNVWIAQKAIGINKDFINEVLAWDATLDGPKFELAKLALLNETVKARAKAKKLITDNELRQSEWLTWPLFDEVRGKAFLTTQKD